MSAPVEVCCLACGNQAYVNRVTAGLRCGCGSTDVDLFDGTPDQLHTLAAAKTAQQPFLAFMREGASSPVGDEIKGWNVYQGPMPGANPWGPPSKQNIPCPTCHGLGFDLQDGGPCRECGGDGEMTPTTSATPEPLVARHPGSSTQTSVPFMGRRRVAATPTVEDVLRETTPDYNDRGGKKPKSTDAFSWTDTNTHYPRADTASPAVRYREQRDYSEAPPGHFAMHGAACPNCGQDPTHLVKDHKENAWWHCPNCGPLANIDKHPEVDPYNPTEEFLPNPKGFKEGKVANYRGKDRGSLLRMVAVTQQSNPGLTAAQVVFLARSAASRYLERS
jgi:hypothetical protein